MPRFKKVGIDVDVNGIIESHRRSFSESENDILRRLLLPMENGKTPGRADPAGPDLEERAVRARGRWTVLRGDRRIPAANLKEAYRAALLLLHEEFPEFLKRFGEEEARARRFVARSAVDLYLKSPALARHHAKPLVDGWFFDTNLSTDQVSRRVRIAARICGLRYGTEFALFNNLEQI